MTIRICQTCHQHYMDTSCPHCLTHPKPPSKTIALALLLGFGLTGCGEKEEEDTSSPETTEDPIPEPDMSDLYGVAE